MEEAFVQLKHEMRADLDLSYPDYTKGGQSSGIVG